MKLLFIIVTMSLVCAGGAVADEAQKTIVLPAKSGDVTFEHQKHIEMKDSCAPCHVSDKGGKIEGFGKEMAHDICKGCHSSGNAGPTKCVGCHHK